MSKRILFKQAANAVAWRSCTGLAIALLGTAAHAGINLADQPLAAATNVPGNLLLTLSVEWPTAVSISYPYSTNPYIYYQTYLGYFDPLKCYQYQYDSAVPANSYFVPKNTTSTHLCQSTATLPLWSGNWLNWASMQTIDTFRWALTGGYRAVDTAGTTVLEKAWATGQGTTRVAPNKTIPNQWAPPVLDVMGATPFNFSSASSRIWGLGNRIWVSGVGDLDSGTATAYTGQNSFTSDSSMQADPAQIYELFVRVKVCDSSVGIESNCTRYGNNYKPEGLIQKYSSKLRYGAFGYLNDPNINRDAGVLRARMKYVGPIQPVPGQADKANVLTEWDNSNGVFITNPDTADAAVNNVSNSGVINYLNKFGLATHTYKTKDPVSELYYAAIRYFKNLGNVASYSDMTGASAETQAVWLDGFPVIANWDDPIQYSCQKNFILGIGDVNTHRDANLPGSTIASTNPAPPEVAADTSVDVTAATNMVGQLEGVSNLGSSTIPWFPDGGTYYIAGLAYDSHVRDMRPNDFKNADGTKSIIQTVSTYWLDVMEGQIYQNSNPYYYATKYGGFTVPKNFDPYSASNGPSTLTDAMWHNNSDTIGSNKRPDNFFTAGQADTMVNGLESAFEKIISELNAASTAFAFTSAKITKDDNASYSSKFDAKTWTGDVIAASVSYDDNDNPSFTQKWSAQSLLDKQTTRNIITCCTADGAGLPFQAANLGAGNLSSRTNYATFANVQGVAAASQSAANYLAYLRGDRSKELSQNGGVYRTRTNLLGDIVDSKVNPVGPPISPFSEDYNPGYTAFKTAYKGRKTVVYVGANDGMMHAFDGTLDGSGAGSELFAYVPSFVYGTDASGPVSGLASLGSTSFSHHYLVDQTPQVFDIDIANSGGNKSGTPNWKSVLIGGLGKGGKGYYAIDVTDPSSWGSESNLASKVMWEFTDDDMGYSYGDPVVAKTKQYGWVVIFASGYNNADGVGYFLIVDPATGALLQKISTHSGSKHNEAGLTHATAYIGNYADGTADAVYSGDLNGNVWRLDLTPKDGSYDKPTKIATLTDSNGTSQPVTTRPLTEVQPSTQKRYIVVGTGRLLANSDVLNSQTQTLYVIADGTSDVFYASGDLPTGVNFPIQRSDMEANTDVLTGIGSNPSKPMGWYLDLNKSSGGSAERITTDPTANNGIIAFASNLPNGDVCNLSGTSRVFATALGSGKSVLTKVVGNQTEARAYSDDLPGVVIDLGFYNQDGKIKLKAGSDHSIQSPIAGTFDSTIELKQLNWREVPTAD